MKEAHRAEDAPLEADHAEPPPEGVEAADGGSLVELILSDAPEEGTEPAGPARIDGVVIGEIAGFDGEGEALVTFPGIPGGAPLRARSAAPLTGGETGREVALQFERGDPRRPLVMGVIHVPAAPARAGARGAARAPEATVDGKKITFDAADEIVFRCGEASITLTRSGKILIRGAYVLTRSSGVNRIQGGSVQIN